MIIAVLGILALARPPAAAACIDASWEYEPTTVAPGERVRVSGSHFGDNCHDQGSLPPGEGVLGRPLSDIDIVVRQGDNEIVVARGAADQRYEFEVDVVIPTTLSPGEARLSVRSVALERLGYPGTARPLAVTDEPAVVPVDGVKVFGPERPSVVDGGEGTLLPVGVAVGAVIILVAVAFGWNRTRAQR